MLPADMQVDWERAERIDPDAIAVVPKWDALTMAYRADGRARFIDDEHQPIAYARVSATSGDGLPLILRGGKAAATWGHRFQGQRLDVVVTPFESEASNDWIDESRFEQIARILGARELRVSIDT